MSMIVLVALSLLFTAEGKAHTTAFGSSNVKRRLQSNVVTEVTSPGTSFRPTTGKLLKVYILNNKRLRGTFLAHDGREIRYDSTCAGSLRIYRPNGTTVMQHHYLSDANIHYAKVEDRAFVYEEGQGNTYATTHDLERKPRKNTKLEKAGMSRRTAKK